MQMTVHMCVLYHVKVGIGSEAQPISNASIGNLAPVVEAAAHEERGEDA